MYRIPCQLEGEEQAGAFPMGAVSKREIPGIGFDVPYPERRQARQSGGGEVQGGGVKAGVPDIFFPKAKWIGNKAPAAV